MTEIVTSNETFEASRVAPHVILVRIVARPLGVFTVAGRRALAAFLSTVDAAHGARCVILTGTGASFSAGSNIKEFEATAEWLESARQAETHLNETIELGPVPVIAACNGHVLGGGAVMALACDIRIACRSATFGVPEVMLGAMPTATGTMRLPMLAGRGAALKLILTGEPITAEEAYRLGLFEEIVDDGELMPRALAIATRIAAVSPMAVRAARRCLATGLRQGYDAGLALEAQLTTPLGLSDDAIEGKAAFVAKRPPVFR